MTVLKNQSVGIVKKLSFFYKKNINQAMFGTNEHIDQLMDDTSIDSPIGGEGLQPFPRSPQEFNINGNLENNYFEEKKFNDLVNALDNIIKQSPWKSEDVLLEDSLAAMN
ncbi:unnamed protein product [Euphydryas editha]|uniref:Uncharacterized protein n=1 Tax=Euphydryas editha TaxID=104508 RepID=A0AAU9V052_EUPED|nr:unnamed protein product [Euphydryas editha]